MSKKCSGIVFSELLLEAEGERRINVIMEAKNERSDIEFEVVEPKMFTTVSGHKNQTTYHVKNIAGHSVKFRPEFSVEPKEFSKYLNRYECLCFREYEIDEGESLVLPASFSIKGKINDEDQKKDLMIRIIYTAKKQ